VLLYFYASGRVNHYLTGDGPFRITVLIAGVIMAVLAVFNLLTAGEELECCHHHDHDHDHDQGHDDEDHVHDHPPLGNGTLGGVIGATLLLLVPISTAALLSPDRFTAAAVLNKETTLDVTDAPEAFALNKSDGKTKNKSGAAGTASPGAGSGTASSPRQPLKLPTFTLADLDAQVDKTSDGHYLLQIPELFYTAGDREVRTVLEGLPVETVGQIMPGSTEDEGNRLRIFRLYIECCIADARPVSIPMQFSGPRPETRELGWVRIVGRMSYPMENGLVVPLLNVDQFEETPEPEDSMLY